MKKIIFFLLFIAFKANTSAQIKGTITDLEDKPLSFVSIYLENSVTGTTSNDNGKYVLELSKTGNYTLVYQILGFKTQKKEVQINNFPFTLNVKMEEEKVVLEEITISTNENPALPIIRKTIANKDKNNNKLAKYSAKFYSRGLWRIKDAPESFMGQTLGDFGGGLDSTRSGIVYLSETVSEIIAQRNPEKFNEKIIASKVAGQDNGISFNRAEDVNFNFYENIVTVGNDLISPISNSAFGYYNYKLVGSFYENGKLINKIAVIPKREIDRVFKGFIYIVEDDWAIYGVNFTITGEQMNSPAVESVTLKQNYNYAETNNAWIVISQAIEFEAGFFGFNFTGKFSSGYSDYNFTPNINEKTFGSEVLSFEENATKKDSMYWNKLRPVPLTLEEQTGYKVKDSISVVRKSKKYLDSVDNVRNKFKFVALLTAYSYRNTYEDWRFSIQSPVLNTSFNTVQGFNSTASFNYFKSQNDTGKWWNVNADVNYGFADEKFRPTLTFSRNWNNISRPYLYISAGRKTTQFNGREPIKTLTNSLYSLLDRLNYMKLYDETFSRIYFSNEVKNGIRLNANLEYNNRKPLFNSSDYSWVKKDYEYTSNNPLDETDFTNAAFSQHSIWSFSLGATINFGQKYLSYPDRKFNLSSNKYPRLYIGYRKNFAASESKLNSDLFFTKINQNVNAGVYGELRYNLRAGIFTEKKDIAFMDYLHANGNQLPFIRTDYIESFGLLEYYKFSTNDRYSEMHLQHNFKGYLWSKIPLLNKLGFYVVGGSKALFSGGRKPYTEHSIGIDNIGFGKWRFLRVDYIRSNFNGTQNNGWLIGFNIL